MCTVSYCYQRQTRTRRPDKKGNAGDVSEMLIWSPRYEVYSSSECPVYKATSEGEDVYSKTIPHVKLLL